MTKRGSTFLIGSLVLALLLVGVWGYNNNKRVASLRLQQENLYQQAFYELITDVQKLETDLSKAMVAATPSQKRENLANIWQHANAAQQNLAKLPLGKDALVNTQKFINQLGDYSFSALKNESPTLDKERLNDLHKTATVLARQLQQVELNLAKEKYPWVNMASNKGVQFSQATREIPINTFNTIEDQIKGTPELIYDGPFSEENITPKNIKIEGSKISQKEAEAIALKFLGVSKGKANVEVTDMKKEIEGLVNQVNDSGSRENIKKQLQKNNSTPIETYLVRVTHKDKKVGDQEYLHITKNGGKILWMISTRNVSETNLTLEEAQNKATEFMKKKGYTDFKPTGVLRAYNQGIVSFARVKDNVTIYPDLIKVKVALDNGSIVGFDAKSYIYSQKERDIPKKTKLTLEEAQKKLASDFTVKESKKAIIPLPSGKEVLTYEFYGSYNGMDYLIYINADTGKEENILRVIKSDNGILTT